MNGERQGISER